MHDEGFAGQTLQAMWGRGFGPAAELPLGARRPKMTCETSKPGRQSGGRAEALAPQPLSFFPARRADLLRRPDIKLPEIKILNMHIQPKTFHDHPRREMVFA